MQSFLHAQFLFGQTFRQQAWAFEAHAHLLVAEQSFYRRCLLNLSCRNHQFHVRWLVSACICAFLAICMWMSASVVLHVYIHECVVFCTKQCAMTRRTRAIARKCSLSACACNRMLRRSGQSHPQSHCIAAFLTAFMYRFALRVLHRLRRFASFPLRGLFLCVAELAAGVSERRNTDESAVRQKESQPQPRVGGIISFGFSASVVTWSRFLCVEREIARLCA